MSDVIKVDVWSDIACPWCYIGKRKFEAGAERFAVEAEYHSFELAPDTPADFEGSEIGLDRADVLRSLEAGEYRDAVHAVHADQDQARRYGAPRSRQAITSPHSSTSCAV